MAICDQRRDTQSSLIDILTVTVPTQADQMQCLTIKQPQIVMAADISDHIRCNFPSCLGKFLMISVNVHFDTSCPRICAPVRRPQPQNGCGGPSSSPSSSFLFKVFLRLPAISAVDYQTAGKIYMAGTGQFGENSSKERTNYS